MIAVAKPIISSWRYQHKSFLAALSLVLIAIGGEASGIQFEENTIV